MPEKMNVTIYTAGSCKGNPGPGGWAVIMTYESKKTSDIMEKPFFGRVDKTSNNRMELQAVFEAVKHLKHPCNVDFKTNSGYIQTGLNQLDKWSKNGWATTTKAKVQHYDIWQKLLELRDVNGHTYTCSESDGSDIASRCKDLANIQSELCTFMEVQNA